MVNDPPDANSVPDEHASGRINPFYNVVRSCQLEGTYNADKEPNGGWPISGLRVSRGWGNVLESDWPMSVGDVPWPIPEPPPGVDEKAKRLRLHHYQRVRSLSQCLKILGHECPVGITLEITDQWSDAENGIIMLPGSKEEIVAVHCITVVGFDLRLSALTFVNSWGKEWGNHGFGYLSFQYFEDHVIDAWASYGIGVRAPWFNGKTADYFSWVWPDPLGHSGLGGDLLMGFDFYDGKNDDRLGWAFVVRRDGYLDVEELFVKPTHRRKGIGTRLIDGILELAEKERRRVRMWVPHGDWNAESISVLERVSAKLGLTLFDTNERWARAVGLDKSEFDHPIFRHRHPDFAAPPLANWLKVTPRRPASTRRKKKGDKDTKSPRPGSTTSQTGPRMSIEPEDDP
jgi:GNAT superfamily N-acetyltransferase